MRSFLIILFLSLLSVNSYGQTCTSDSRTNVSANSILTSTKYNSDLNTLYNRLNGNLDGGCISSGSIEGVSIGDAEITIGKLADGTLKGAYASKSSNYTLTSSDDVVTFDATSGDLTATLPTAVGIADKIYIIKKTDTSTNTVTVDGNGSETVDGNSNFVLRYENDSVAVISDNTNWQILDFFRGEIWYSCDINNNGTASLESNRQCDHWVSSVNRSAAGTVQVTMIDDIFGTIPNCSVTGENSNDFTGVVNESSTTFITTFTAIGNVLTDYGYRLICTGARP